MDFGLRLQISLTGTQIGILVVDGRWFWNVGLDGPIHHLPSYYIDNGFDYKQNRCLSELWLV